MHKFLNYSYKNVSTGGLSEMLPGGICQKTMVESQRSVKKLRCESVKKLRN